jgi:hypothetical protein
MTVLSKSSKWRGGKRKAKEGKEKSCSEFMFTALS